MGYDMFTRLSKCFHRPASRDLAAGRQLQIMFYSVSQRGMEIRVAGDRCCVSGACRVSEQVALSKSASPFFQNFISRVFMFVGSGLSEKRSLGGVQFQAVALDHRAFGTLVMELFAFLSGPPKLKPCHLVAFLIADHPALQQCVFPHFLLLGFLPQPSSYSLHHLFVS